MLQSLDKHWQEHLAAMDHLRQGIHLRGYAQKDPKQEFKRESFELFSDLLETIKLNVTSILSKVQIQAEEDVTAVEERRREATQMAMAYEHADATSALASEPAAMAERGETEVVTPFVRSQPKVGRNAPCPCGSGKKYKHCHGSLD